MRSLSASDIFFPLLINENTARRPTITAMHTVEARAASIDPFPKWMDAAVSAALQARGITAPYTHQVAAWQALLAGQDVLVATPTASGKSLCYNAPVASLLRGDPSARALYVFPTKALARDQETTLRELLVAAGCNANVAVYDGDTPSSERQRIRQTCHVILTNPDMLHAGILPNHPSFASFFAGLKIAVVDEIHIYRGVFGAHVANVLRRLRRVARFHGSHPVFATATATIANPQEHAQHLLESSVTVIERSGAPTCQRLEVIIDPGFSDPVRGIRRSALSEAARLASTLVQAGRTTLVFCETRRAVEVVLRHVRRRMEQNGLDPSEARGYRGGYLPGLRREIEAQLKEGRLRCAVATSALELGIDVGQLDAVVMAGYPGTVASFRQRAGRAGRRDRPSLCALVVGASPLDQYLARHEEQLFDASAERALVRPNNIEILLRHLVCAAFELPFAGGDTFGGLTVEETEDALSCLAEEERLQRVCGGYVFVGNAAVARDISLRGSSAKRVVVYDIETGEQLAEVDEVSARRELHPHAIYQIEGQTYFVETLDLEAAVARVRAVVPTTYTVPLSDTRLEVMATRSHRGILGASAGFGDVRVDERVTGFKRLRIGSHENLGTGPVDLPAVVLDTEAMWLEPSGRALAAAGLCSDTKLLDGLSGLSYVLSHIAALRLMCDPKDLAAHVHTGLWPLGEDERLPRGPALFLYDAHCGGVGLSESLVEQIEDVLFEAAELVAGCGCAEGCPACIGPLSGELDVERKASVRTLALAMCGLIGAEGVA
ncbi:MAG: DEAD/DEAH box helicase [Myxococcota bacterium]|jgi:DEAD/DEAH box helicase domain-containing protein|nr:DEAD/DEAH box helicase [Myxococcota bacterium]